MKELFLHNLKAGWMNVLKYKTQNIISVLCLSVGAVFFAIALYFANGLWENRIKYYFSEKTVKIENLWEDNSTLMGFSQEQANKLQKLPAVKSICYTQTLLTYDTLQDCYLENAAYISPDWLELHNYRSATTGEKIGKLKPGTMVSIKRNKGSDPESHATVPVGTKVELPGNKVGKVSDIVYSTTNASGASVMMVAPYCTRVKYGPTYVGIDVVTLNDGYTAEQFKEQFHKAEPRYRVVLVSDATGGKWVFALLFVVILLVGASVLIAGMSGYLKMQLQLFCLRSREMALRCCNGAKPVQLFMLLCSELLIIFLFTAAVSISLFAAFAGYVIPHYTNYSDVNRMYIHLPTLYCTVIVVVALAFVAAIGIAWFTVRKMLHNPLSTSIGSTNSQHTVWNRSMQVAQYVAVTILLTVLGVLVLGANQSTNYFRLSWNMGEYKKTGNILCHNSDLRRTVAKLSSVEKCGWLHSMRLLTTAAEQAKNKIVETEQRASVESGDFIHDACVGNVETFKLLRVEIESENAECGKSEGHVPVYVRADEASSVIQQLEIEHKPSSKTYLLPGSNDRYILLGWAHHPVWQLSRQSYCVIDEKMHEYDATFDDLQLFVVPKDGDIDTFLQQARRYGATTMYDSDWCRDVREFVFSFTLLLILAIVSVISIVLTIYSSISLETRGRQKEVAVRKVNGAKTRDIVLLFSRYYLVTLGIAFGITALLALAYAAFLLSYGEYFFNRYSWVFIPYFISVIVIPVVTLLTVWHKIYRISHINPANLIKKE